MCFSQTLTPGERCEVPTQIVPAASLRYITRLPAARVLVWVSNYLIFMVLWSIGRAIFRVEANFLPVLREGPAIFRRGPAAPMPPPPADRKAPKCWRAAARRGPTS